MKEVSSSAAATLVSETHSDFLQSKSEVPDESNDGQTNKDDITETGNSKTKTHEDEEDIYKIEIFRGMSTDQIALLLESKGIINEATEFSELVDTLKLTNKLRFGVKEIPVNSSLEEILDILTVP